MSMKKVCDRCNKVMEVEERFSYIELVEHTDDGNEISGYDLCPECVKQFNMFINEGDKYGNKDN